MKRIFATCIPAGSAAAAAGGLLVSKTVQLEAQPLLRRAVAPAIAFASG